MIKFRFYDLEERAEALAERGVPKDLIADFVALIETWKQHFNEAKANAERRDVILAVRDYWRGFIRDAKEQVR